MFILIVFCLILTISIEASNLQTRVVELESVVELRMGTLTKTCVIKEANGCFFDVSAEDAVFLRVLGPNGHEFETWISALKGSNASLFIHLLNGRHHFIRDNSVKIGDLVNSRLLSGFIIPQTSGKRRKKVSFED